MKAGSRRGAFAIVGGPFRPGIGGVSTVAVTDEAIDRIKAMILSGELRAGARLPREDELADQLGLSRNSLREAVRALTAMRILVVRQGDGTYVSSLEPQLLLESLSFAADVSQGAAALHFLQVRRMLEPQVVALAAGRITEPELRTLRDLLDRGELAGTPEEFIRLDALFHRTIAMVAGNPVAALLLDVLSSQTQRVRLLRGAGTEHAIDDARRDHEAILRALAAGDAQLAASTAAVHVAAVESWVRTDLS